MSTGTWAACILVILVLRGYRAAAIPEAAEALQAAQWTVFWLLVGALVVLAITGGVSMSYWKARAIALGESLEVHRRLLWVKHILFVLIYGAGTAWMWLLIKG